MLLFFRVQITSSTYCGYIFRTMYISKACKNLEKAFKISVCIGDKFAKLVSKFRGSLHQWNLKLSSKYEEDFSRDKVNLV